MRGDTGGPYETQCWIMRARAGGYWYIRADKRVEWVPIAVELPR